MNGDRLSGVTEWDESYALQDAQSLWGEPPVPYVEEAVYRWFEPRRPALEVPCGDGRNTVPLARRLAALTAADSSPRALVLAAERLAGEGLAEVEFATENVFSLSFADNSFVSVLCWDLLSHLKDPAVALAELRRVCEGGGVIVANLFSRGDSTRGAGMTELAPDEYLYDGRFYFRYYGEPEVRELLAGVEGLKLRELSLTSWREGPHEGYREYEHDHESWAVVMEVIA